MRRERRQRRGIALIWVAIFFMVFVGLMGLAIDNAWLALTHHQLQNAADAASLAGARWVRDDATLARNKAMQIAAANTAGSSSIGSGSPSSVLLDANWGNSSTGDIVIGRFDKTQNLFTATMTNPNAVKVTARRTDASLNGELPMIFGPLFGTSTAEASRSAIAVVDRNFGPGLLVLDPTGSEALIVGGSGFNSVAGGLIQVNSSSSTAVRINGSAVVQGLDGVNIVGCASPANLAKIIGEYLCYAPPIPDPLAHLPEPVQPPPPASIPNGNHRVYTPGYYENGITNIGNGVNAYFEPGIYYLSTTSNSPNAKALQMTGGNMFAEDDEGVLFYIKKGQISISGGQIRMKAASTGVYKNVPIFQARSNASDAVLRGGGTSYIQGTMYFPGNVQQTAGPTIDLAGSAPGFSLRIITWRLEQTGGSTININYDDSIEANPKVYLVH